MNNVNKFQRIKSFDAFLKKVGNIYYYETERMDRAYQIVANYGNFSQSA